MLHRQQFGVFEQKHKEMQRDVFYEAKDTTHRQILKPTV